MARILLADDDGATRDLVKRALESDGHTVSITQDGMEALETLTTGPGFDVLVSDVHMPGLDGVELARRAIAAAPELKLLLMSGFAEELERAQALKTASLGVIIKPFSLDQIRAAVRALLA
ncbi:MAG: response regulator [Hyphomicrobium sp.]|jgi:two-component system cell cycle response regulator CpdR|uniref:response regulator n=1 Tax=Hyphomicrobium sp. TaxID=82 RepID=UPI0025C21C6B|nr:response regulator [Hyphomicrobium sp.]MBX9863849.1 response regulator [Hyphomicrobium sp.]